LDNTLLGSLYHELLNTTEFSIIMIYVARHIEFNTGWSLWSVWSACVISLVTVTVVSVVTVMVTVLSNHPILVRPVKKTSWNDSINQIKQNSSMPWSVVFFVSHLTWPSLCIIYLLCVLYSVIASMDAVRLLWSVLRHDKPEVQASAAWAICPCVELIPVCIGLLDWSRLLARIATSCVVYTLWYGHNWGSATSRCSSRHFFTYIKLTCLWSFNLSLS